MIWRVPRWVVPTAFVLAPALVPAVSVGQVPSVLAQSGSAWASSRSNKQVSRQDVMDLARTSWRCTTSARLDDPPRQGYLYFHPNGDVKMAQVVPASNRERPNNILWWRTREDYNDEDPTGRKWTDLDWLDDGNIWASRRDEARIIYGSPPGLMILTVSKNLSMQVRFAELDDRSRILVEGGETDPFALTEHPVSPRSTMTCRLRPGWLQ